VLFSVGLAACGSSSDSGSETKSDPAGDMETAKKLVLVTSDLPPGWKAKPDDQSTTPEDKAGSNAFSDCVGTGRDESRSAKWSGDTFSMDDDEISSETNVASDKAVYRKDIDAFKSPKLGDCVKTLFTKLLTEQLGEAPTSFEVSTFDVAKYGDATVGVRMKVALGPPVSDTIYVDVVVIGKDRAEVTSTFSSVGQPIDAALEKSLIAKQGARVEAA